MTDNANNIVETEQLLQENQDMDRVVVFEEALEAILFAAGHPISYATLARVFNMTPGNVKEKVFQYSLNYNDSDIKRGVILLTFADSCQLCTKQYYLTEIREALGIKKSGSLSTSSMEALAIIAYNQPVTRVFVDTLRRADSSYAMNNLLDRGLIESKGRLDAPGRPMLYGTTQDFLRCFGLKDLNALPKTGDELMEVFEKAKATATPEQNEENEIVNASQLEMEIAEESEIITQVETIEEEIEDPSAEEGLQNEDIQ